MDTLIAYPENNEQLAALKAVMKAMKVSFEQKSGTYPDHVLTGIKQSVRQADEGKLMPYTGIKDMLKQA